METNWREQIGSCVSICLHKHNYIQDPSVKDSQVRIREMAAKSSTDVYLDAGNMCKKDSLQPPPSDFSQPWYDSPAETAYQDLLNLSPRSAVYNKPTSSILTYKINTLSSQATGAHLRKHKPHAIAALLWVCLHFHVQSLLAPIRSTPKLCRS